MALKFGSATGRREQENYRISDAELICANNIFTFVKEIQKTTRIDDEFPVCSIGVILPDYSTDDTNTLSICPEQVEVRLRERARPKYKSDGIYELGQILQMSQDGTAATILACPIKVEMTEIVLSCRYKGDGITYPSPEEILKARTADGITISDLIGFNPGDLVSSQAITSKRVDKPIDDFWDMEIEYTGRIGYPDNTIRNQYIQPIEDTLGISIDETSSTVDISLTLRNNDNPRKSISITVYGLKSIND